MSDRRHIEPVEDYTKPFLISLGVIFFVFLYVILAIWGFLAMIFSGYVMDRSIAYGGMVVARFLYREGGKS